MTGRVTVHLAARGLLVFGLIFIATVNCFSQNESGTRSISKTGFQALGYWYDSSLARYEERYPILRSLPPVHSGMPENVLRSYIYLDSIMRFGIGGITASQIKGDIGHDIKELARHFYTITDYNPVAFTQYRIEVSLLRSIRYQASLQILYTDIRENIKRNAVHDKALKQINSILYPDYVLRVRIMKIDSIQKDSGLLASGFRYRATATVVDTLKGRFFRACTPDIPSASGGQKVVALNQEAPCIQFQYSRRNYFDPESDLNGGVWLYPNRDPAFMTENGSFRMEAGQEAVVFLSHYQSLFDSSADYLNLSLDLQGSFNALPIFDGKVRDVNSVWADDGMIPYDEWKLRFEAARRRISTMIY